MKSVSVALAGGMAKLLKTACIITEERKSTQVFHDTRERLPESYSPGISGKVLPHSG